MAAHLFQTPEGYLLHLLHWAMARWQDEPNVTANFPALGTIRIRLAVPRAVTKAFLLPGGEELSLTRDEDTVTLTVPGMRVWRMIKLLAG